MKPRRGIWEQWGASAAVVVIISTRTTTGKNRGWQIPHCRCQSGHRLKTSAEIRLSDRSKITFSSKFQRPQNGQSLRRGNPKLYQPLSISHSAPFRAPLLCAIHLVCYLLFLLAMSFTVSATPADPTKGMRKNGM